MWAYMGLWGSWALGIKVQGGSVCTEADPVIQACTLAKNKTAS